MGDRNLMAQDQATDEHPKRVPRDKNGSTSPDGGLCGFKRHSGHHGMHSYECRNSNYRKCKRTIGGVALRCAWNDHLDQCTHKTWAGKKDKWQPATREQCDRMRIGYGDGRLTWWCPNTNPAIEGKWIQAAEGVDCTDLN